LPRCCGADFDPLLRVALCRGVTKQRSAILLSLLAHAAVIAALILAKPTAVPPLRFQTIEVSLVADDPAFGSTRSPSPPQSRADLDSVDAKQHGAIPNWFAPSDSALDKTPAISKLYVNRYVRLEFNSGLPAGVLNCLTLESDDFISPSTRSRIPDPCPTHYSFATVGGAGEIDANRVKIGSRKIGSFSEIGHFSEPAPTPGQYIPLPWNEGRLLTDWQVMLGRISR